MAQQPKKIKVVKGEPLSRDVTSMDGSIVLCKAGTIVTQELLDRLSNWIVEEKPRDYSLPETPAPPKQDKQQQRDRILKRMEFAEVVSRKTQEQLSQQTTDFFSRVGKGEQNVNLASLEDAIGALVEETPDDPDAPVKLFELKAHASYMYEHSIQCGILGAFIATNLNYPQKQINAFATAMMLHDTGILDVPSDLLDRRDNLQGDERQRITSHTVKGFEILKNVQGLDPLAPVIAMGHHVLADGTGYPADVDFHDLPPLVHLSVIINQFESLTAERPYRPAMPMYDAVKFFLTNRNKYHPGALENFLKVVGVYPISTFVKLNTGETGVVVRNNQENLFLPEIKLVMDPGGSEYSREIIVNLMSESDRQIATVMNEI